jgi:hypothetical protein
MVLFCILISCKQTEKKFDGENIILTERISEEISINELFGEFEYISLETSKESIFGEIKKLIVYDDKYYILDNKLRRIFVFQHDGTFVHTIGRIGQGPGEYTHIEDFQIDEVNSRIIILGYPSILYFYDFDGNFIEQKLLMLSPMWSMCCYRGGLVLSNNHQSFEQKEEPLIFIYDWNFNLKSEIGKVFLGNILPPFISHPFLKDGEKIAYFDNVNSSIYLIDLANPADTKTIKFLLKNPIPPDVLSNIQKFQDNQGNHSFFLNAYLADNILWTSFASQGSQCVLVRNMKNKIQFVAKYTGWYPPIMSHVDDYFYAPVSVQWLLDKEFTITSAKQITPYPIDYDSNPVIVRFKSKFIIK